MRVISLQIVSLPRKWTTKAVIIGAKDLFSHNYIMCIHVADYVRCYEGRKNSI